MAININYNPDIGAAGNIAASAGQYQANQQAFANQMALEAHLLRKHQIAQQNQQFHTQLKFQDLSQRRSISAKGIQLDKQAEYQDRSQRKSIAANRQSQMLQQQGREDLAMMDDFSRKGMANLLHGQRKELAALQSEIDERSSDVDFKRRKEFATFTNELDGQRYTHQLTEVAKQKQKQYRNAISWVKDQDWDPDTKQDSINMIKAKMHGAEDYVPEKEQSWSHDVSPGEAKAVTLSNGREGIMTRSLEGQATFKETDDNSEKRDPYTGKVTINDKVIDPGFPVSDLTSEVLSEVSKIRVYGQDGITLDLEATKKQMEEMSTHLLKLIEKARLEHVGAGLEEHDKSGKAEAVSNAQHIEALRGLTGKSVSAPSPAETSVVQGPAEQDENARLDNLVNWVLTAQEESPVEVSRNLERIRIELAGTPYEVFNRDAWNRLEMGQPYWNPSLNKLFVKGEEEYSDGLSKGMWRKGTRISVFEAGAKKDYLKNLNEQLGQ